MTLTRSPRRRRAAAAAGLLLAVLIAGPVSAEQPLSPREQSRARMNRMDRTGPQGSAAGAQFGYYYRWNPEIQGWDLHYGYHTSRYEVGPEPGGVQAIAQPPSVVPSSTLVGVAERLYRAELLPRQGDAAVVIVRLPDGSSLPVSLGRWEDLENLDLRRGDELVVRGRPGLIGVNQVFMASEVELAGERFGVVQPVMTTPQRRRGFDRRRGMSEGVPTPAAHQQASAAPAIELPRNTAAAWRSPAIAQAEQRRGEIDGPVQELFYTSVPGVPGDEVLVRVRIAGEPERIISLGSGLTPHQLERVEDARWLQLRGRATSVGGEEVILADRISVDGYTFGVVQGPALAAR